MNEKHQARTIVLQHQVRRPVEEIWIKLSKSLSSFELLTSLTGVQLLSLLL